MAISPENINLECQRSIQFALKEAELKLEVQENFNFNLPPRLTVPLPKNFLSKVPTKFIKHDQRLLAMKFGIPLKDLNVKIEKLEH